MFRKRWSILAAFALFAILASCSPSTPPTSSAPAVTPPPASATSAPTPVDTAQQTAWDKVIQAAKTEGQVNVYTWGWTGDTGVALSKAFEVRYGIKLNIITGRGAEFLERIKTENRIGNVVADFWEGASSHSENMKLAGLLDTSADLPVLRDKAGFSIDPFTYSPEGYYLTETKLYTDLFVNTNLVKSGEEPKSWADLLDPKWKGNILFADPELSVSSSYFAVLIDKKLMTLDYLQKLGKQSLKFDPSTTGVAGRLARGEAAIGYSDTISVAPLVAQGATLKVIDTSEGFFIDALAVARVKNGPHPNATRVLINWFLSKEGQDVYAKAKGAVPVRNDVPDYSPPALQLKPKNPVFITAQTNDIIAKAFREKQFAPLLKPQ